MRIIVTGSLAFDQIMSFPDTFSKFILPDQLATLSVSFLADKMYKNFGGVAGNICYNLALLGKQPICFACAGHDARHYRNFLKNIGVNTDYLKIINSELTGNFFVITDQTGNQISGFYPGAMAHDRFLDLNTIMKISNETAFLAIAPTVPLAMNHFVTQAIKLKLRYAYAPAQQIPRLDSQELKQGISHAEIIFGNNYEINLLMKKTGWSNKNILNQVKLLITTQGKKGSIIEQKGRRKLNIDIVKPKRVADPTGAGDAYLGGFLAAYLDLKPLRECGDWAATAASLAMEQFGTTGHNFTPAEFQNRLPKYI